MGSISRVETSFRRLKWLVAARRVEISFLRVVALWRKAGFNPDQPRHPKGTPEGGRWSGGSGGQPGIGHNQGPPLEDAPEIPQRRPLTRREVNNFLKAAARWLAKALRVGVAAEIGVFVAAYQVLSWLDTDRIYFEAYQDPPKSLEELQQAVSTPKLGYDVHHIVEQTPAEQAGFSRDQIDAPENLVRIPTLKHWEINAWYQRENPKYGGLTPRNYLRDKDWTERTRVGLDALIERGILKP
jgi:hypothetical protein